MSVYKIINSLEFLSMDQFERRKLAGKNILNISKCKIGMNVLCFENEILINNKSYYNRSTICYCDLTIGKEYKIINIENDSIKIQNDSGLKVYNSTRRFLYSLSYNRKEKIKQINKQNY